MPYYFLVNILSLPSAEMSFKQTKNTKKYSLFRDCVNLLVDSAMLKMKAKMILVKALKYNIKKIIT